MTTDRDVLQSQGGEWCTRLQAAGVPATSVRYGGVMHDFFGLAEVLDKAAHAQQEAALHLGQAFSSSVMGTPAAVPLASPKLERMSLRTTPLCSSTFGPFDPSPG